MACIIDSKNDLQFLYYAYFSANLQAKHFLMIAFRSIFLLLACCVFGQVKAQSELFVGAQMFSPLANQHSYQRPHMEAPASVATFGFSWQKPMSKPLDWRNKLEMRFSYFNQTMHTGASMYSSTLGSTFEPGTLTKTKELGLRYELEFYKSVNKGFGITFGPFADLGHTSESFQFDNASFFARTASQYGFYFGYQAGVKGYIREKAFVFCNALGGAGSFSVNNSKVDNSQQSNTILDFDLGVRLLGVRLGVGYVFPEREEE